MRKMKHSVQKLGMAFSLWSIVPAWAALPDPTPAQQEAAAAKKAAAAAKAEEEKKQLAASMESVAARWRERAESNGWPTHPPTPVAAIPGFNASANQTGPSGQPGGKLGAAAADAPVRSEKSGTAPRSEDVKKPTPRKDDTPLSPGIYPGGETPQPTPAPAR